MGSYIKNLKIVDPDAVKPKDFLNAEYNGRCQICATELMLINGGKYFEVYHIFESRGNAFWADRPFNILSLCPNCHALAKHGGRDMSNIYSAAKEVIQGSLFPVEVVQFRGDFYVIPVNINGKSQELKISKTHMSYLVELFKAEDEAAIPSQGIAYCNKLFDIEEKLEKLSPQERKAERLKQEKKVLDAFWAWVDSVRNTVLPKSKLGEALNYAFVHKKELMNYLENGHCVISNNLAENSIRPFTIGRKNWLFSGSPKGAAASAAVYSIVETAKANGLNPYKYLLLIFRDMPGVLFKQYPEFLEDYLPWSPEVQKACK